MVKVSFAGAYGIRSQGDDAALLVAVEALQRRYPSFEAVVIARHAQEDPYAAYGLRSIQNLEYDTKAESVGRWFRGFNYDDDRDHLWKLQEAIGSSDLLMLGAGNALIDITIDLLRGPIPLFVLLTLLAKMSGTPVMWYGISVGPFRTEYGRSLSRLAATLADAITVRDARSCAQLEEIGYHEPVVQLPDPVVGLEPAPEAVSQSLAGWREAQQRPGTVIAVSVRDIPPGSEISMQDYLEGMAALCDSLVTQYDATLLFIPHCTYHHGNENEDDRNVASWIVARMQKAEAAVVVQDLLTVEQCLSLYRGAEIALCTRLHGNVYAAIQGVPPVPISYNPKVAAFIHSLGCGEDLVVPLGDFQPSLVLEKVNTAFAERHNRSSAILAGVKAARVKVEEYATIAATLIERSKG